MDKLIYNNYYSAFRRNDNYYRIISNIIMKVTYNYINLPSSTKFSTLQTGILQEVNEEYYGQTN